MYVANVFAYLCIANFLPSTVVYLDEPTSKAMLASTSVVALRYGNLPVLSSLDALIRSNQVVILGTPSIGVVKIPSCKSCRIISIKKILSLISSLYNCVIENLLSPIKNRTVSNKFFADCVGPTVNGLTAN